MRKQIRRRTVASAGSPLLCEDSPVLSQVYAARGVKSSSELTYQLQKLCPPGLKGMDQATDLLAEAMAQGQKILIVGDFDADGATSTALAVRCLRAMGHSNVDYIVPNRFEYGYGLTPEIVEVAAAGKPDLIVTVDNGISSLEGVARALSLGIKVLITDHHLPGAQMPPAHAVVNPNQLGCEFPSKAAAGVAVIFYVLLGLRTRLREKGWFSASRPEPNLSAHLDLVALGTVADVVPLDFNNRILVDQGLKRMRAGLACPGINAILEVAGRNPAQIAAQDLGFAVGPRLNAAGRLDDMSVGIRCLLADDPDLARELAQELDGLNRDRRAIEAVMQKEALLELDRLGAELDQDLPSALCLYQDSWHQGVIGILASRIKDRLHRPVIVFADDEQGGMKGSGRSIPGIHLRDALDEVATSRPGLLTKFGGHAMAAGLSLAREDLAEFSTAFAEVVSRHLGENGLQAVVETDGELQGADLCLTLAERIEQGGPWGQGFPEPAFDGIFTLINQKLVGEKHLKLTLAPEQHSQTLVDAIAFNVDRAQWPNPGCATVRAAYRLSVNDFRGRRSVQMIIEYLEPV